VVTAPDGPGRRVPGPGGAGRGSVVYAARVPVDAGQADIDAAVRSLFDALGGIERFVPRGSSVLVKPNAVKAFPPDRAITTHPSVVSAVLRECARAGPGRMAVGDSSMTRQDTRRSLETSGIADAARSAGVPAIDLKRSPAVRLPVEDPVATPYVEVYEEALAFDVVVNVPKLKTNVHTRFSCGIKNMKGLVTDDDKRRFHSINVNLALADLARVVTPDVTVVDAVVALEGFGPSSGGEPRWVGLLLASDDVLALDVAVSRLMGYPPADVRYLAETMRAQGFDPDSVTVVDVPGGRAVPAHRLRPLGLRLPPASAEDLCSSHPNVRVSVGDACCGCIGVAALALHRLRPEVLDGAPELELIVGRGIRGDPRCSLLVGSCALDWMPASDRRAYRHRVPGCTPSAYDVERAIERWARAASGRGPG